MGWQFVEDDRPTRFRDDLRREPTLREMIEHQDMLSTYTDKLKKEIKDKEDKEKNKKKKIEFPKFSLLELTTIFFVGGFIVGPWLALNVYMDMMIKILEKAKLLGPLLGR